MMGLGERVGVLLSSLRQEFCGLTLDIYLLAFIQLFALGAMAFTGEFFLILTELSAAPIKYAIINILSLLLGIHGKRLAFRFQTAAISFALLATVVVYTAISGTLQKVFPAFIFGDYFGFFLCGSFFFYSTGSLLRRMIYKDPDVDTPKHIFSFVVCLIIMFMLFIGVLLITGDRTYY